jgi:hypothetical protein
MMMGATPSAPLNHTRMGGRHTSFPGFIPPFHLIQTCDPTLRRDLPSVPPLRHVGMLTSPTRDEAIARTPLPISTISLPCTPTTSDLSPKILLICPWTFFAGSTIRSPSIFLRFNCWGRWQTYFVESLQVICGIGIEKRDSTNQSNHPIGIHPSHPHISIISLLSLLVMGDSTS